MNSISPIKKEFHGIEYYKYNSNNNKKTILFIHGLGVNKNFFNSHLGLYGLSSYSWIVPDLIGHGESYKAESLLAYSMKYQAEQILQILFQESVSNLIIVAHSMGSTIAYYLITSILRLKEVKKGENYPIDIKLFISVEGNIDENDAFFPGQIASTSWNQFNNIDYLEIINDLKINNKNYYETIRFCSPWDLYASSIELVKISNAEITMPLIEAFSHSVPVKIFYGEKNKGFFTSELLLKKKFEIEYIPNSGHDMLHDNPKGFWDMILKDIERLDKNKRDLNTNSKNSSN